MLDLVFPRNCPLCRRALDESDPGCICPPCLAAFWRVRPPICRGCGRPVPGEVSCEFLCSQCRGRTLFFDRAVSACLADARLLDAIHRFKYQREIFFGPALCDLLVAAARQFVDWKEVDAIVPVPLHPRKERERQFNQARILAKAVGRQFGKPLLDHHLRRVVDTPSQTFLNAEQRQRNLHRAFLARRTDVFAGQRLVLVDDVYTTGSTANLCARELKRAGATSVLVLTLARAI